MIRTDQIEVCAADAEHVTWLRLIDVDRANQMIAVRPHVVHVDDTAQVQLPLHTGIPLLHTRCLEVVAVADEIAARRWSAVPLPGFESFGSRWRPC